MSSNSKIKWKNKRKMIPVVTTRIKIVKHAIYFCKSVILWLETFIYIIFVKKNLVNLGYVHFCIGRVGWIDTWRSVLIIDILSFSAI